MDLDTYELGGPCRWPATSTTVPIRGWRGFLIRVLDDLATGLRAGAGGKLTQTDPLPVER
jgi:hypothetical protein